MKSIDLDKAALDIARKRLLQQVSYRHLAEEYFVSPATLHRKLNKWLADGRFDLSDMQAAGRTDLAAVRDDDLAEQLVGRTGIWRARVIRTHGSEAANVRPTELTTSGQANAALKANDELHRALGAAAAELILGSMRKNMTIGVSSGRGVGFAIEMLATLSKRAPSWVSRCDNVRLVSLCGGGHVGALGSGSSRDFDADENAFALADILSTPRSNVSYVTGPVVQAKRLNTSGRMHRTNLDIALIGLGQLNSWHPYFRAAHAGFEMPGPLGKLLARQAEYPEVFANVAEIVLRLYEPSDVRLSGGDQALLAEVNESLLAIPAERLHRSGEVVMVAGGGQKIDALHRLLTGKYASAPIDRTNLTLVTDASTAETIICHLDPKHRRKVR